MTYDEAKDEAMNADPTPEDEAFFDREDTTIVLTWEDLKEVLERPRAFCSNRIVGMFKNEE